MSGEKLVEDIDILKNVLWNAPEEIKPLYSSILDLINPEKNKILKFEAKSRAKAEVT